MSRYIQRKFLGSGTYSEVYLAEDTIEKRLVALKKIQIERDTGIPATTLREISILKSLDHPNILRYIDTLLDENECIIIFEYVEYTLLGYLQLYKNNVNLIEQLLEGILYIHQNKIMHRDLKPENILVTSLGVLKIADFNLARNRSIISNEYAAEVVTLWYRSPELLEGKKDYSYYIDIWSVGCIIAEILGSPPVFRGSDNNSQLSLIYSL
ncbi:CMGC/CDK protein kinase, partial [Anncaliia algerae PRA109]